MEKKEMLASDWILSLSASTHCYAAHTTLQVTLSQLSCSL